MEVDYYSKYLKYKNKYTELKKQLGGDAYKCDTKKTADTCKDNCKWDGEKCRIKKCHEFDKTNCNKDICETNKEKTTCEPKSCVNIKKEQFCFGDCIVKNNDKKKFEQCVDRPCKNYDFSKCPTEKCALRYTYKENNQTKKTGKFTQTTICDIPL
jgi:hypothetical protein